MIDCALAEAIYQPVWELSNDVTAMRYEVHYALPSPLPEKFMMTMSNSENVALVIH